MSRINLLDESIPQVISSCRHQATKGNQLRVTHWFLAFKGPWPSWIIGPLFARCRQWLTHHGIKVDHYQEGEDLQESGRARCPAQLETQDVPRPGYLDQLGNKGPRSPRYQFSHRTNTVDEIGAPSSMREIAALIALACGGLDPHGNHGDWGPEEP